MVCMHHDSTFIVHGMTVAALVGADMTTAGHDPTAEQLTEDLAGIVGTSNDYEVSTMWQGPWDKVRAAKIFGMIDLVT